MTLALCCMSHSPLLELTDPRPIPEFIAGFAVTTAVPATAPAMGRRWGSDTEDYAHGR